MRYFGGMTAEESSVDLGIPVHIVRRELRLALAWLRQAMAAENSDPEGSKGLRTAPLQDAYTPAAL